VTSPVPVTIAMAPWTTAPASSRDPFPSLLYLRTRRPLLHANSHLLHPPFPFPTKRSRKKKPIAATVGLAMAPLLRPSPRQTDTTKRCASMSSFSWWSQFERGLLKSSSPTSFSSPATADIRRFRRRQTSPPGIMAHLPDLIPFSFRLFWLLLLGDFSSPSAADGRRRPSSGDRPLTAPLLLDSPQQRAPPVPPLFVPARSTTTRSCSI
jgi:hypothetical protein